MYVTLLVTANNDVDQTILKATECELGEELTKRMISLDDWKVFDYEMKIWDVIIPISWVMASYRPRYPVE